MVGHRLVTHQTSREGVLVQKVMIAEAKDLLEEKYFAILLDRLADGPVMIGSPRGGVDIEAVADETPELIFTESINDIRTGPSEEQLAKMATNLGFSNSTRLEAIEQMRRLWTLFRTVDATQVEINPLGVTPDGEVLCFDAKINFDDNAAFRQQHIFSQADLNEADPRELEAVRHNLNYIGMEGSVGCLVNGAGLAMATMDLLNIHGASPANFLDVGGSAQPAQIAAAFRILLSDPNVRSIFVNIFGGIMRCDLIAEGIIKAVQEGGPDQRQVPLVVRLQGTNDQLARKILKERYPEKVLIFEDLDEAARSAVMLQGEKSCLIHS